MAAWTDLALARQPEAGLPANLHVDPHVPAGCRGHATAFAGVSPPDYPDRRGADVPGPGPSRGSAAADRGSRCPHRLHVRWRHPGQCARLPSDDAAGTAIHRPRDGAHHRAARWHRSSGPGWEWRGLEEQRHVVRDPPGHRGGPAGRAGGRARCGFATHHRPARLRPVRSSPSCRENATAVPLSERTGRISANGRFVALISAARLVERDRNDLRDVYVFDGETGLLSLESLGRSRASLPTARAAPWTSAPTGASWSSPRKPAT